MNQADQLKALQTYFNLMAMNGGTRVFQIAHQMGIYRNLAAGPTTAKQLAEQCGLKEKPTELLLNGLQALNTVQKEGDCFSLSPVMAFLAGNYQDLSSSYWDHFPEFLKTGVPISQMDNPTESEMQYQKQVAALDWMMKPSAEMASMMLGFGTQCTGAHILDVGCGSAVWSIACAKKDPTSTITALDWPAVLKIAHASAEISGIKDRFTSLPGNYHETVLSNETYDMIFVGNVTHLETPEGNRALFAKLYKALKTGGKIVIFDVFSEQEQGKLETALYTIGLALRTLRGEVYPVGTLISFLIDSGFTNCTETPLAITPYTMGMLVATK